ncbi:MAG: hypothetical protein CL484_14775 [Acidobacteria bacterium]|nr:hypothetical protein [Acidobacteriota bacterium]
MSIFHDGQFKRTLALGPCDGGATRWTVVVVAFTAEAPLSMGVFRGTVTMDLVGVAFVNKIRHRRYVLVYVALGGALFSFAVVTCPSIFAFTFCGFSTMRVPVLATNKQGFGPRGKIDVGIGGFSHSIFGRRRTDVVVSFRLDTFFRSQRLNDQLVFISFP